MFGVRLSDDYSEYKRRREQIKSYVTLAREELKGTTLYGEKIDLNNPEDIIACLYILYKDYNSFHERM